MKVALLQRKSRKQLLDLAKAAGIKVGLRATRNEIIRLITAGITQPPKTDPAGLPRDYGRTRLVLMEVEPRLVYAYWEVTPRDSQAAIARLRSGRESAQWVLRFYDVTGIYFDGLNAHGYFDVPIDLEAGNWYIQLWEGEKTYFAEIGPCAANARLIPLCRSNFVYVPQDGPSSRYEPQWLKVDGKSGRAELVKEPSPARESTPRQNPVPKEVRGTNVEVPRPMGSLLGVMENTIAKSASPPALVTEWALPPVGESGGEESTPGERSRVEPAVNPGHAFLSPDSNSIGLGSGGTVFPHLGRSVTELRSGFEPWPPAGDRRAAMGSSGGKWVKAGTSGGFIQWSPGPETHLVIKAQGMFTGAEASKGIMAKHRKRPGGK